MISLHADTARELAKESLSNLVENKFKEANEQISRAIQEGRFSTWVGGLPEVVVTDLNTKGFRTRVCTLDKQERMGHIISWGETPAQTKR